ncbi:cobQ/CobB/MinD/ParA nucleotide binding domain protein, partial [Vibrio parahaemolyticus AQ3810]
VALCIR